MTKPMYPAIVVGILFGLTIKLKGNKTYAQQR